MNGCSISTLYRHNSGSPNCFSSYLFVTSGNKLPPIGCKCPQTSPFLISFGGNLVLTALYKSIRNGISATFPCTWSFLWDTTRFELISATFPCTWYLVWDTSNKVAVWFDTLVLCVTIKVMALVTCPAIKLYSSNLSSISFMYTLSLMACLLLCPRFYNFELWWTFPSQHKYKMYNTYFDIMSGCNFFISFLLSPSYTLI